jgi:RNA recognition motif-containing protein
MILLTIYSFREGRARGYAFIYAVNEADVEKIIQHMQGKRLMSREIQAKKYEATERSSGGYRERP